MKTSVLEFFNCEQYLAQSEKKYFFYLYSSIYILWWFFQKYENVAVPMQPCTFSKLYLCFTVRSINDIKEIWHISLGSDKTYSTKSKENVLAIHSILVDAS